MRTISGGDLRLRFQAERKGHRGRTELSSMTDLEMDFRAETFAPPIPPAQGYLLHTDGLVDWVNGEWVEEKPAPAL